VAKTANTRPAYDSEAEPKRSAECKTPWSRGRGPLLSKLEAADHLGVTDRQIRRLLDDQKLITVKVGGLTRLRIDDLDAYIEANSYPAPA
jgi:excisionase family DNA binding protein